MTREEKIALLVDELEDIRCNNFDANTEEDKTLKEVVRVIKTLKQESKTGYWIIYDVHGHKACKCSECDKDVGYPCNDKYCKHCGVKMIGHKQI